MRKIIWNKLAKDDYLETIEYLIQNWSEKEAQKFIDDVNEILLILTQGNIDFQETDYINIRRCVIREQVTLFYRIIDNNKIELLRFWNNSKDVRRINI